MITSEALGGGELFTTRLAEALARVEDVRIVGAAGSPILYDAAKRGIATAELPLGRKLSSRTAIGNALKFSSARRRLDNFLADNPADLIVLQYKWEEILWGGRQNAERVVLWEHGPIPSNVLRIPFTRRRLKKAFEAAQQVFAISDPARGSIESLARRAPVSLNAGIDARAADAARSKRQVTRRELDIPDDAIAVVVAGRITEDKGIFDAIAALSTKDDLILLVCGDGPAVEAAKRAADVAQSAERVRWLGWRDDVYDVIAAGDALAMLSTSHGEGRPLVVLEAHAVGTNVVGFRATPALAAMESSGGLLLADAADPAELAALFAEAGAMPRVSASQPSWDDTAAAFLDNVKLPSSVAE